MKPFALISVTVSLLKLNNLVHEHLRTLFRFNDSVHDMKWNTSKALQIFKEFLSRRYFLIKTNWNSYNIPESTLAYLFMPNFLSKLKKWDDFEKCPECFKQWGKTNLIKDISRTCWNLGIKARRLTWVSTEVWCSYSMCVTTTSPSPSQGESDYVTNLATIKMSSVFKGLLLCKQ